MLLLNAASAQLDTDCHLTIGDNKYDLSELSGDRTLSRTRQTPPTSMTDTLRFNVCKDLSLLEGVDASEQVSFQVALEPSFQTTCVVFEWDAGLS